MMIRMSKDDIRLNRMMKYTVICEKVPNPSFPNNVEKLFFKKRSKDILSAFHRWRNQNYNKCKRYGIIFYYRNQ